MKEKKATDVTVYEQNLFATDAEMRAHGLNVRQRARILRLRSIYTFWKNAPMLSNREVVAENRRQNPQLGAQEAYNDVKLIKYLIGNLEKESKEWHRYCFNNNIRKIYELALERNDLKTAERALADYAKYNRLHENDPQQIDYEDIRPHEILPTTDPTVIGIQAAPDLRERIERLKRRFAGDIEDAEVIEEEQEEEPQTDKQ